MNNDPYLKDVILLRNQVPNWRKYPFHLSVIKNLAKLSFTSKVCFFIGENGTGKSTLLEAMAANYGFGKEGGSRNISFSTAETDVHDLSEYIRLSWSQKILGGYFFRAESFFNVATYIDEIQKIDGQAYNAYGGQSLHTRSHGQSFLALITNRFSSGGFYILDEPEAALSPKKQLELMRVMYQILQNNPKTQFIIATHSPILVTFPDSQVISFNGSMLEEISYEETENYQLTKAFLNDLSSFYAQIFEEENR